MTAAALLLLALAPPAFAKPPRTPPVVSAPPEAERLDLLAADYGAEPKLARPASALVGVFQLLVRRPPGSSEGASAASPPDDEGGRSLFAQCSGSFVENGAAVTAAHCIQPYRDDLRRRLVLRRHLFRLHQGRLTRTGYADHALSGRVLAENGDIVMLELSRRTPAPRQGRFPLPAADYDYPIGQPYQSLGYRSAEYGVPSLARHCSIEDPVGGSRMTAIRPSDYYVRCLVMDGMSGGPHFLIPGGVQIGVNSSMTLFSDGQFGTSTKITSLSP